MDPQQPTQHSHTHLYIIVGVLVVFALLFLTFKTPLSDESASETTQSTPLGLKRVALTVEQLKAKESSLSDPNSVKTAPITKTQVTAKKETLTDTKLQTGTTLTEEQIRAKQESFNK